MNVQHNKPWHVNLAPWRTDMSNIYLCGHILSMPPCLACFWWCVALRCTIIGTPLNVNVTELEAVGADILLGFLPCFVFAAITSWGCNTLAPAVLLMAWSSEQWGNYHGFLGAGPAPKKHVQRGLEMDSLCGASARL
jgi:hypothetical protein